MARPPAKVIRSTVFASRRRHVRRERQRRRRRVTISVFALLVLAIGGWMLARSSLFALERIEVAGMKTLSRADIVGASGLHAGASMLSLDIHEIESRVARLPLVRTVDVTKPAPSHIRIEVTERAPAFILQTIYGTWYVDGEGVVLGTAPDLDPALATIRSMPAGAFVAGNRVRTGEIGKAMDLWSLLPKTLRSNRPILEAWRGGITLIRAGLTVKFGAYERIDQKLDALRLVMDRARAAKEHLVAIDLRSPGRPSAVARR